MIINFNFYFSKHVLFPVTLFQNFMFQAKYCLELMLEERVGLWHWCFSLFQIILKHVFRKYISILRLS